MLKAARNLILVGAGDFAHEVLWLTNEIVATGCTWKVAGFLDDNPDQARRNLKQKKVDLPVLGTTHDYQPHENECFLLTIGTPKAKLAVGARLRDRGAEFINAMHPSLTIMQHARIGTGCVFMARTVVGPYAQVGDFVIMNNNSGVAHDTIVEDGVTLSGFCDVTGKAVLRKGAFLGSHAVVLPSVCVGEFAIVGAGSMVHRDVDPGDTVIGVPAKVFFKGE